MSVLGETKNPVKVSLFSVMGINHKLRKIKKMGEPYSDTFPDTLPQPSDPDFQQHDVSLHIYVSEWIFVKAIFSGTIHIHF